MNYKNLGNTDLKVSTICLGTMTWGEQNTEQEGYEQMDFSLDQGVNFWDTAELYSVPPKADTFGFTEVIIGTILIGPGETAVYDSNISFQDEDSRLIVLSGGNVTINGDVDLTNQGTLVFGPSSIGTINGSIIFPGDNIEGLVIAIEVTDPETGEITQQAADVNLNP